MAPVHQAIYSVGLILISACSSGSVKPNQTASQQAEAQPSPAPAPSPAPSSDSTKVYSCTSKRETADIMCMRYFISENMVNDLKKSCLDPNQNTGLTNSWAEADCGENFKSYNRCEVPGGASGIATTIYGGLKEGCTNGTFTAGTASGTSLKNDTGATPGSAESLACIADLVAKVTGTWKPASASEYSTVEMRSYTLANSDPDKYFRFYYNKNGTGSEHYFIKADTACAKTDKTYKLYHSAAFSSKALTVTLKSDTVLSVEFANQEFGKEPSKFTLEVKDKGPVL